MLHFVVGPVVMLLVLSIIVTFHEFGHFSVARLFKTRVEGFSVGFGNILWSHRDKSGVLWAVRALPLGGYVKFAGDENIASMMPSRDELDAAREAITEREGAAAVKDYFHFKPLWQRFLIILAGPAANFILAIFIFTIVNLIVGEAIMRPTVAQIISNSPASVAGFQTNDTITRIDGHPVESTDDVHELVALRADTPIAIDVERNHQTVTLHATPSRQILDDPNGLKSTYKGGFLGLRFEGQKIVRPYTPWEALVAGNHETWDTLGTTLTYIGRIFTGKENGDQISGPIGMTKAAGDIVQNLVDTQATPLEKVLSGVLTFVQFTAFISIGIGFLNLLPIPVLDGGHLMFYVYQSVAKKPVPAGIQNAAFRIAIVLVLGLMLFAAWNDINHTGIVKLFGG